MKQDKIWNNQQIKEYADKQYDKYDKKELKSNKYKAWNKKRDTPQAIIYNDKSCKWLDLEDATKENKLVAYSSAVKNGSTLKFYENMMAHNDLNLTKNDIRNKIFNNSKKIHQKFIDNQKQSVLQQLSRPKHLKNHYSKTKHHTLNIKQAPRKIHYKKIYKKQINKGLQI